MRKVLASLAITLAAIPLISWVVWLCWPATQLNIVIIDKTVSTPERTEHRCVNWILSYDKYVKRDGTPYSTTEDYLGFFPLEGTKYEIRDFAGYRESAIDRIASASGLVYVTDTYGVYSNEWPAYRPDDATPHLIYGGLANADLTFLQLMLRRRKPVIAEFNFVSSPTPDSVRRRAEQMFGIRWSGWTGRYYESLDTAENSDLPSWVVRNYMSAHHGTWPFTTSGIVLVNRSGALEVLEAETHLSYPMPLIQTTENGISVFGLPERVPYPYWFEIVNPSREFNVPSYYFLQTTAGGDSVLRHASIPKVFPAVLYRSTPSPFYYFAGDFADNPVPRQFWAHFKGFVWLRPFLYSRSNPSNRAGFFWEFYYPLVSSIFERHSFERSHVQAQ